MNRIRTKGWCLWGGSVAVCVLLYWLSIGPVVYLAGIRLGQPFKDIPLALRIGYFPLFRCPFNCINSLSDHYVIWWISKNGEFDKPAKHRPGVQ